MQNAATTTDLKRRLFIWLILRPNVLFHNSGSQPIPCSLTTFQHWINTVLDLAHWKRPAITHAGKATRSELISSSSWIVVGKINAHGDLCLFLQVTFTLADLICAGETTERPSSASQLPKVKLFSCFSGSFSFLLGLILFFQPLYYCHTLKKKKLFSLCDGLQVPFKYSINPFNYFN